MSTGHILVTGGAGYIGSHVCCALKKRGFVPIVLDNLSHGHPSFVAYGPLVEGDISDSDLVNEICRTYQPRAALHFAGLIDVAESVKNPNLYMYNNYEKAALLFESLQRNKIDAVVFSSTAAVYGAPHHTRPLTEEDELCPINPYGVSKLKAELFLGNNPRLRSVCLRYFNAAGADPLESIGEAHWPESHLIPNALLTLLQLKEDSFYLYGNDFPTPDGTALRDYIHVLDLARAHIRALEYLLEGHTNLIVNLGSGTGASVKQVLEMTEQITHMKIPLQYAARRPGDPPSLVANNQRAHKILGWLPRHNLADIIQSAYDWHRSNHYKELITPLR